MEGEDGAPMIGINAVEEKRNILNKLRRSDIFECVERRKKMVKVIN